MAVSYENYDQEKLVPFSTYSSHILSVMGTVFSLRVMLEDTLPYLPEGHRLVIQDYIKKTSEELKEIEFYMMKIAENEADSEIK
jgi:hypothetical protein